MPRLLAASLLIFSLALLTSCARTDNTAPNGPHATVMLRDGSSYPGVITKSSPKEITVAGDDKTTRTIAMADVRSIDYGEAPAAEAAPASEPPVAAAPPAAASRPSPSRASRQSATGESRYHPQESTINTKTYQLPVGTEVAVRTDEVIDSSKTVQGQTYAAEIYKDVRDSDGAVVIPRGSNAHIVIRSAAQAGRVTGASNLVLDLASVSVEGRQYNLSTTDLEQRGREGVGKNKRTGEFVGGGAALGAIIGAIAGGGKGAAIGAASGAGAGAATQVLTRGGAIRVPAETVLTFKLDKPLRVSPARN